MRVPFQSTFPNVPLTLRSVNSPYSADSGATLTVQIRKPGGAWQTPAGAVIAVGNGFYELVANAADRNTPGPVYVAVVSSSDPNVFLPDTIYEVDEPIPAACTPQQTINVSGALSATDSANLANAAAYLKILVNSLTPIQDHVS